MNTKYFPYKRLNDLLESYDISFSRITDITLNNGKHVDGYSFIYHDEYYTIYKDENKKYTIGKNLKRGVNSFNLIAKKENMNLTFKQLRIKLEINLGIYDMMNI